jgi:hypothetical protein
MTDIDSEDPPRPKGIQINTIAPLIDTVDIYENPLNLKDLLQDHNGVLIDFFRGNW